MLDKSDEKTSNSKPAKKAEKRGKFVHLAEARTRNAIKAIRIIGKLGNKNAYEYSQDDVKKIASALNKEVEAMKSRMSHAGVKDVVDFEL